MNIINKMKLTFVLGLLLSSCGMLTQENPVVENGQSTAQVTSKQESSDHRVVTFVNNIEDMVNLIDPSYGEAIETALKHTKVYVNGHLIAAGKSIALPLKNNTYVVEVVIPEIGLEPIIKMKKILSWFQELAVTFTAVVPEDENEVEILYPVIAKEQEWNRNLFTKIRALLFNVRAVLKKIGSKLLIYENNNG